MISNETDPTSVEHFETDPLNVVYEEIITRRNVMPVLEESYDVVVVGAGHAGCEAALASARLGLETIVFTVSVDSIAMMPCNPNVGGSSKGHLVREVDALGGEMGKNIDATFLQSKMLNESKGPAVHSLRAQADKHAYTDRMRHVMENSEHLTIRQGEVAKLLVDEETSSVIVGVQTVSGAIYHAKAVVLATGVYLRARCIYGDVSNYTGPNGLMAANHLTASLQELGIEILRFKTGTPARVDKRSIDFSKMVEQKGDERIVPFSFSTDADSILFFEKRAGVLAAAIDTDGNGSYETELAEYFKLGDVNEDDSINAKDANVVLIAAARIGTGRDTGLTDARLKAALS